MYRKTMQRVVLVCLLALGLGVAPIASAMPASYAPAVFSLKPVLAKVQAAVSSFLAGWFSQDESSVIQKDGECPANCGTIIDPNGG